MKTLLTILLSSLLLFSVSCNPKNKVMSLKDYAKIESEVLSSDMTNESKEKIAKKYGFTLKQYIEMETKVGNDTKLQEKIGEIRMKNPKSLKTK